MYWTAPVEHPAAWPRIGISEVVVVLAAVDLLFLVFVVLQVAYLFGGRDTLAVSGMTYSDYAHGASPELVVAAALSAGLVLAFDRILGSRSTVFIGLALGLLGLTVRRSRLRGRSARDVPGGVRVDRTVSTSMPRSRGSPSASWSCVLLARGRTRWVGHGLVVRQASSSGSGANVIDPSAFVARQGPRPEPRDPSLVPPGRARAST
jgi:hypothetical protein